MKKITQEFLDELIAAQENINRLHEELSDYLYEHEEWKEKNLGKNPKYVENEMVNVYIENETLMIDTYDKNRDLYELGDLYEDEIYAWPLEELLSDDWKEPALKEYQAKLEKINKERAIINAQREEEIRKKELEELKRLQEKYCSKN